MPWMDDPLELLGSASVISILDLEKVCGEMELVPQTRLQVVFIILHDLYKYICSLFIRRIILSPSSSQSFISKKLVVWEYLQLHV